MIKLDLYVENGEVKSNFELPEDIARADLIAFSAKLDDIKAQLNALPSDTELIDVASAGPPITADARSLYNQNNLCGSPTRMIIGVQDHTEL